MHARRALKLYSPPVIQSPFDGHVSCFQFLAVTNKTAMSGGKQVLCEHKFCFPLGK